MATTRTNRYTYCFRGLTAILEVERKLDRRGKVREIGDGVLQR